jgi:hypothetical protein
MRQILSDIRALAGVTGVAVIAKRTGKIEHLFPAAFSDRHTQYLRDLVSNTYQRLRGFTRLALRFERVVVHLYNQPEFLLFLTTLPDTETRQCEQVVNSKFGSIARALAQGGDAAAPAGNQRGGASTRTAANGAEPILRLVTACGALTDQLADSRGRLRLANDWRRAREAANTNGTLDAIMVDAAGRLQVRKGQTLAGNAATMQAIAAMIDAFLESLETQRPLAEEELYVLLRPHHDLLEQAGFFIYLEQRQRSQAAR